MRAMRQTARRYVRLSFLATAMLLSAWNTAQAQGVFLREDGSLAAPRRVEMLLMFGESGRSLQLRAEPPAGRQRFVWIMPWATPPFTFEETNDSILTSAAVSASAWLCNKTVADCDPPTTKASAAALTDVNGFSENVFSASRLVITPKSGDEFAQWLNTLHFNSPAALTAMAEEYAGEGYSFALATYNPDDLPAGAGTVPLFIGFPPGEGLKLPFRPASLVGEAIVEVSLILAESGKERVFRGEHYFSVKFAPPIRTSNLIENYLSWFAVNTEVSAARRFVEVFSGGDAALGMAMPAGDVDRDPVFNPCASLDDADFAGAARNLAGGGSFAVLVAGEHLHLTRYFGRFASESLTIDPDTSGVDAEPEAGTGIFSSESHVDCGLEEDASELTQGHDANQEDAGTEDAAGENQTGTAEQGAGAPTYYPDAVPPVCTRWCDESGCHDDANCCDPVYNAYYGLVEETEESTGYYETASADGCQDPGDSTDTDTDPFVEQPVGGCEDTGDSTDYGPEDTSAGCEDTGDSTDYGSEDTSAGCEDTDADGYSEAPGDYSDNDSEAAEGCTIIAGRNRHRFAKNLLILSILLLNTGIRRRRRARG